MPWVYIIQSCEGYVYTGSTTDIEKRLFQHQNHLAGWTKRGTNWKIIHLEEYATLSEARKREKWYKTGIGRDYIKEILSGSYPDRSGCWFKLRSFSSEIPALFIGIQPLKHFSLIL